MGADRLYTEYALCLPRHWTMAAEGGDEAVAGEGRRGGAAHAVEGDDGGNGDFAAGGTTQVTAVGPQWSRLLFASDCRE